MEEKYVVHRDLKPDNIIMRRDKGVVSSESLEQHSSAKVCIIDFGFAADLRQGTSRSTGCGTVGYMAPETILKKESEALDIKLSSKFDVFSAGVIFYELYSRTNREYSA
jgi:serine/threonine protein kinase